MTQRYIQLLTNTSVELAGGETPPFGGDPLGNPGEALRRASSLLFRRLSRRSGVGRRRSRHHELRFAVAGCYQACRGRRPAPANCWPSHLHVEVISAAKIPYGRTMAQDAIQHCPDQNGPSGNFGPSQRNIIRPGL